MDALIGWTGLTGSTILRARPFDACYRSVDIETMRGGEFDLVVCCGVRAEKWKANSDPEGDRAAIAQLTQVLETVRARHLVLISTVDVYPSPTDVDEDTSIDADAGSAYGRHRLGFEQFCQARFSSTVVRLPGLFGTGLKKNAIFDLLQGNVQMPLHPDSAYQFYGLDRLWGDIERVRAAGIALVNLSAEPTTMRDVAMHAFGRELAVPDGLTPARYDVRSRHAAQFGGRDGYWYDAPSTLDAIAAFVARERAAPRPAS